MLPDAGFSTTQQRAVNGKQLEAFDAGSELLSFGAHAVFRPKAAWGPIDIKDNHAPIANDKIQFSVIDPQFATRFDDFIGNWNIFAVDDVFLLHDGMRRTEPRGIGAVAKKLV